MKKRLFALIFSGVVLSSALTGCSNVNIEKTYDPEAENINSMFVLVEEANQWYVAYDKETKVMYAVSRGGYNIGNFTLLVDENGNPKLWDGE